MRSTLSILIATAAAVAALNSLMILPAHALSPQEAERSLAKGTKAQADAQEKADTWSEERAALNAEERDLVVREKWLAYRIKKYEAYIANQKRTIQALQQRKEAFVAMQMELEPLLDESLDRLEAVVAADLPFLAEERGQRLGVLRETLNDHRLPLADKLRRTLEALRIEAEYGSGLEVTDEFLDLGGEAVRVRVLRLGRLALFYRSPDGRSGRYDPAERKWKELDPEYIRALTQTMDMAERRRAVELVQLPITHNP